MPSRNVTSVINWFLDNVCPPVLRDCKPFMYAVIYMAYGKKTRAVMEFKDRFPLMTQQEIDSYYALIKDAPINRRPTDLNKQSVDYILDNIVGSDVLDAACGRGFLARRIAGLEKLVTGLDIEVPDHDEKFSFVQGCLSQLPFDDNSFDTVLCTHALEHITDGKKALNELLRVARHRVIIIVPCQREYRYTPDLHITFFPYIYSLKKFVGIEKAEYLTLGNDFCCVIDL